MKKIIFAALIASTALSSASVCAAGEQKKDYFVQFNTGYAHGSSSTNEFSQGNMGNSSVIGVEAGYKLDEHFRMSASFDYLPGFSNNYSNVADGFTTTRDIKVKSYVSMLNLYYDIGQFNDFTPYATIGAGIARNKTGLYTANMSEGTYNLTSVDASHTKTNFAYKLGLGSKYKINDSFDLDLRYQYANLGKFKTGTVESSYKNGVYEGSENSITQTGKLSSHQILLGVRVH
jgi:opacity protein-like surface antigen